jgi:hypothetical protein
MKEEGKRISRRWRTAAVLAMGVAIGTVLIATPAASHIGTVTHLWNNHIKPKADARYFPGGTMPAGHTIRGTYWMGATAAAGFDLATSEISFGYRFVEAPTAHFIQNGDTPPPECPGTASNPRAQRGHLCVYESLSLNAAGRDVNGPGGDGSTYRFGARLFVRSTAAGTFWSGGTWAATSGSATTTARPSSGRQAGIG